MGACQSNAGASVSDNVVKIRNVPDPSKKGERQHQEDEKSSAKVILTLIHHLLGRRVLLQHRQFFQQKYKKVSPTRPLGARLDYHGQCDVGEVPRWHHDGGEEQSEDQ